MKKILMTLAAISLCACSICACSDDDDKKNDKGLANGATCANGEDCQSGFCSTSRKKCAPKPAGDKANDAACEDNEECQSGYCDISDANAQKCADLPPEPEDCSNFKKMCGENEIAYVSCSPEEGIKTVDCKLNTDTGKTRCYAGNCVSATLEKFDCIVDEDCQDPEADNYDPTKPYCNSERQCVATKEHSDEEDNDCGAGCAEGTCYINICVTDAMTQEGAECSTYSDDAYFCVGDVFWKCKQETSPTRTKEDCKAAGYGSCSRYRDERGFIAGCTGTDEMIAHCTGESAMLCDPEGIDKYNCIKDVRGRTMTVWAGDSTTATPCPNGCEYDTDGTPKCK